MTPLRFPSKTTPWCVQLPGRFAADRKRKTRYFKTREEAAKFVSQVKKFGLAAVHQVKSVEQSAKEFAPQVLDALERLGGDPAKLWEAVTDYERSKLSVKPATVREGIEEFCAVRKKKVARRTHDDDRWRLLRLLRAFEYHPLSSLSESDLRRFFDKIPGHSRSIYKTVKVFFRWAREYGYLALNPMDGIRPTEDWGTHKGIYAPSTFERMLRIAAGLEGPLPGEAPTKRFIALLPWFALSGFCGLRSCEAFPSFRESDAIRWGDFYFSRGFVEIRDSVAKRTRKSSSRRHIETAHYLEALRSWLALCPKGIGFVVPVRERRIGVLKTEFTRATGIKFVENGFRNSFASYALTYDGLQGVGKLALEMGNSEPVCKRFYVKTLEPRTGKAWFNLRPEGPVNVIALKGAA